LLRRQWSPEQIAGWLKRTYPVEPQKQVSHETIYRSLFIQARGVLKKELLEHLRARRTVRRSRHASMKRNGLGQIKNAVSISERPPSVEDRAVSGHWEGDFVALADRFGHLLIDPAEHTERGLQVAGERARIHRVSAVLNLEGLDAENQMRRAAVFLGEFFAARGQHARNDGSASPIGRNRPNIAA
jgi:IS30 family transposase